MQTESNPAVLRLWWLDADPSGAAGWLAALAPEVEVTVLDPERATAATVLDTLDDRPYAVLGLDRAAGPAFELARALSATRVPACLIVAGPVVPGPGEVPCPVVAFLPPGPAGDELAGEWQSRAGAGIAVRRLLPGFRDRPDRETTLAVKEELRVWPS